MEYRRREDFFNRVMVSVRGFLYWFLCLDAHKKFSSVLDNEGYVPLLVWSPERRHYRFACYCRECPANRKGLCCTPFSKIPVAQLHEFDGDNIVKNYCG